jgi:peptide deformylase
MGKLKLKIFPDPILEKECDEIKKIDKNIIKLSQDIIETMIDSDGIGLSAPQVGILKRIFVCKDFSDEDNYKTLILINPKITSYKGKVQSREGCLSIPGFYDYVSRHETISMVALDINGDEQYFESDGMQSIVFQHEFDHLDGILFPERMTNIKKDIFLKKIKKEFKG